MAVSSNKGGIKQKLIEKEETIIPGWVVAHSGVRPNIQIENGVIQTVWPQTKYANQIESVVYNLAGFELQELITKAKKQFGMKLLVIRESVPGFVDCAQLEVMARRTSSKTDSFIDDYEQLKMHLKSVLGEGVCCGHAGYRLEAGKRELIARKEASELTMVSKEGSMKKKGIGL